MPLTTEQYTIKELISQASGGIKFTKLLVEWLETIDSSMTMEELEKICRNTPGIKVLDYTWNMGNGNYRHKMFVHEYEED